MRKLDALARRREQDCMLADDVRGAHDGETDVAVPARRVGMRKAGDVVECLSARRGDEITLALAPGLQLVGFAAPAEGLRVRQRVVAWVDESSVVVALGG